MPHALIIDDQQSNIDALGVLLQREGVTYTTLLSPYHLDAVLGDLEAVDLVFLDLEFPNYDGFLLVDELRRYPALNAAPIIAYTVHTSEIVRAQEAGFDGFIGKPLSVREFPEQLQQLLNGDPVWYLPD
ncbi:MAG: response regulator [Chloroflexi bacterium]|nr:response regulator [Chloroflexota bacterium]